MRAIAIVNQKGGCGKTTTAISLAGALAASGRRVLLVDMDPQSHCAAGLAIPEDRIEQDVGDAMLAPDPGRLDLHHLLWRISRNLDLLPSRMRLAALEASRGGLATLDDKDQRLSKLLASLRDYDLAILDCSPSIGLLTYNALCAASEVLIPVETSYFAQQGAAKQVATLGSIGRRLGREAKHWILPTIHEPDAALPRELLAQLRATFGQRVCPRIIHRDEKVREAATFGRPVVEYAPDSQAAHDYQALAAWLMGDPEPQPEPEAQPAAAIEAGPTSKDTAKPTAQAEHPPASHTPTPDPQRAAQQALQPSHTHPPTANGRGLHDHSRPELAASPAGEATNAKPAADPEPEEHGDAPRDAAGAEDKGPDSFDEFELERVLLSLRGSAAFGAHAVEGGVWIVQPIGLGRMIGVAGEFNGWSPLTHQLRPIERMGVHALRLSLPVGAHPYRLIVDGLWTADPFNPRTATNPFGEPNSIAEVHHAGGRPAPRPPAGSFA